MTRERKAFPYSVGALRASAKREGQENDWSENMGGSWEIGIQKRYSAARLPPVGVDLTALSHAEVNLSGCS